MRTVDLFNDKVEEIRVVPGKNSCLFKIFANEEMKIKINWFANDFSCINIEVDGSSLIEFEEIGEPKNVDVHYLLGKDSNVKLNKVSFDYGDKSNYVVDCAENASLMCAFADFSYGNKKFNFTANLNGEQANATWHLAALSTNEDVKDYDTSFNHNASNTSAIMENYGVAMDKGTINFLGTSRINKGAHKSTTRQTAKVTIFDNKCKAKASPILCIDENDIDASHAASVGQINEDHIFYLMSRGINEEDAKRLITLGYLNPIINYFSDKEIQERIKNGIVEKV